MKIVLFIVLVLSEAVLVIGILLFSQPLLTFPITITSTSTVIGIVGGV